MNVYVKVLLALVLGFIAVFYTGCGIATQTYKLNVKKTSANMTESEKQVFLNYFIENFTTYKTDSGCVLYSEKNFNFTKNHKYCYEIKNNTIDKIDNTACTFYDRARGTVGKTSCLLVASGDTFFHESISKLEKDISLNFDKYLAEYQSIGINDIDIFFKYKANKKRGEDFSNYKKREEEKLQREQERAERIANERKKREQEKELKEKAEKYLAAKKHHDKIEQLRNRKGQQVMVLPNSYSYKAHTYRESIGAYVQSTHVSEDMAKKMCEEDCLEKAFENTGYGTLQEALSDGWKFKAKTGEVKEQISQYCICENISYILEK